MSAQKIYFISDAHLGTPNILRSYQEQEDSLISFLRSIRKDAEILYIVGDLFDFWFEYRTAVPKTGARILFELYILVQSGVRILYLPGNHDIWLGSYLSKQVGIELPSSPLTTLHQDLRFFILHGDNFQVDWKYQTSQALLKNPICIALFRLIHPDLGSFIARTVSRITNHSRHHPKSDKDTFLSTFQKKFEDGYQVIVCGHYHQAFLQTFSTGTLVVLGDWIRQDTYAVLNNGRIKLKKWRNENFISK